MTMFLDMGGEPLRARGSGTTLASAGFSASTLSGVKNYLTDLWITYASAAILKVLLSGTVVFQQEYGNSGVANVLLETPIAGTKGQALTVTLDGSGTSIVDILGFRVHGQP